MTDVELFEQHRKGGEEAFATLVRRHLGWVYGVARRRLRDTHLAEDVAQAAFILLHKKSPRFASDRAMISWLYKTTRYATEAVAKTERRRRHRETQAAMLHPETTSTGASTEWEELAPMLDQLIEKLDRADREVILLRYFREMSFEQIALQCNVSDEAARKRVSRAVEKLRRVALERGLNVASASLSLDLARYVLIAPPPGLIATTAVAAIAPMASPLAGAGASIAEGINTMMTITRLAWIGVTIAASVLFVGGTAWVLREALAEDATTIPTTNPTTQPGIPPTLASIKPDKPPRGMPFTAIRWQDQTPEVFVNAKWWELASVDDQPSAKIVAFAKNWAAPGDWQRRFSEDLTDILTAMGQNGSVVNMQLRTLDTHETTTMNNVPMTERNRAIIMFGGNGDVQPEGTHSLFSAVRWFDGTAQVQVNANKTWYALEAINGKTAAQIFDFAKKTYGDTWQKQIEHNSVEIMQKLNPEPDSFLQLRTMDTHEKVLLLKFLFPPVDHPPMPMTINDAPVPHQDFAKLSPFSAVRWQGETYQVQVHNVWYELISLNDQPTAALVAFAQKKYGDRWQKRIDEDLVEVLSTMDHAPGQTVKLELRNLDTGETVTLDSITMTAANRRAILIQRNN